MSVSSEVSELSAAPARLPAPARRRDEGPLYGRTFWLTYLGNTAFTIAMALMYRYADFVLYLGGTEWNVGLIVGLGMVGSLAMRLFQGYGIDHFGARRVWLWSNTLFVLSLLAHLTVSDPRGPWIFVLRILYATSLAGVFGSSITSISRRLPLERTAEVIGTLGTSGFIGMAVGPMLGDYFCGHEPITRTDLVWMFTVAAALGTISLFCAELATRHDTRRPSHRRSPMLWVLKRYHPGGVMFLAVVLGFGLVIPTTFLPTFIEARAIENTGTFWVAYAGTAFMARLATRSFPQRYGVRPMILIGLASLAVSLLLYLPVRTQWALVLPGVFAGISHAVLFPSVTAQGATSFPSRYRGMGTSVMLAMLDTGMFVGAPVVGRAVEVSQGAGLPPYTTTFVSLSIGVMLTGVCYALFARRR
ncbi:MAG: MFS transporter [Planctomycetota bacterium]|nr:MAG: MFS transporter [Planctomycetota bacterium]